MIKLCHETTRIYLIWLKKFGRRFPCLVSFVCCCFLSHSIKLFQPIQPCVKWLSVVITVQSSCHDCANKLAAYFPTAKSKPDVIATIMYIIINFPCDSLQSRELISAQRCLTLTQQQRPLSSTVTLTRLWVNATSGGLYVRLVELIYLASKY